MKDLPLFPVTSVGSWPRSRAVQQALALATSLGWYAWYVAWTRLATQHLARAQTSDDSRERLTQAVAGLRAAGRSMASDAAYAGQIVNDAVKAALAARKTA